MSKTLLLIRHAKSSWNDPSITDFERPLNDRGKKDAPEMAERLLKRKVKIDVFITSPAKRARKTCTQFAKAYEADTDKIILQPKLYEAGEDDFSEVIKSIDDKYKNAAVFSHNPGITYFANTLTETHIDNMPTCSIFAIRAETKKWSEFKDAKKEFLFFDYPKAGQD